MTVMNRLILKKINSFYDNKVETVEAYANLVATIKALIEEYDKDTVKYFEQQMVQTFQGLFEELPELEMLPLFVWGRQEYSGYGFSMTYVDYFNDSDYGFFKDISKVHTYGLDLNEDKTVLQRAGEIVKHNSKYQVNIKREDMVSLYKFDSTDAKMFCIAKDEDIFKIIILDCSVE